MELTIEYLVVIEKKTSGAFYRMCDSPEAFNKFLQSESTIKIVNSKIQYNNQIAFAYSLKTGDIEGKEQRYFHIKLSSATQDLNSINQFVELNRVIKDLIYGAGSQPQTLWNDVSLFYAKQAYPLIHQVENLMRKLITYFMLTRVGKEWATEATPNAVKEAIDKSKRQQYFDTLHQVDFIHLGDFLFKNYAPRSVDELYDRLDSAQKLDEFTLDDLRGYRARSNWERYFSKIVKCDDVYIEKRWKQLYDLRNKIAHNAVIGKEEFKTIELLVSEVSPHLQAALDNLDKVVIPEEDKEQVAENVASNISVPIGDFIQLWKAFEAILGRIAESLAIDVRGSGAMPLPIMTVLHELNQIDEQSLQDAMDLGRFRNALVHASSTETTVQEIVYNTERLEALVDMLQALLKPVAFNKECVKRVEKYLGQAFVAQTRTTYLSQDGEIALTCAVSKVYDRNTQPYYWFGFHRQHRQFLEGRKQGFAAFGCGSEDLVVLVPIGELSKHFKKLSVSETPTRYYWHVHILVEDGKLFLRLSGADPIELSRFVLPSSKVKTG